MLSTSGGDGQPSGRLNEAEQKRRRQRRRRGALLLYGGVLAVWLALALEGGARLLGYRPYRPQNLKLRVEPGGRLFQSHPVLGYTHLPGAFQVTQMDGYSFRLTHGADTLRITRPPAADTAPRPALWLMGCSFTHGWSLDDSNTYPWRLQSEWPELDIHNFGVNGYGTLHGLLQFREFLKTHPKPVAVVATYAYFHNARNTMARNFRKAVAPYSALGSSPLPWAWLDRAGQLHLDRTPLAYREWPWQRHSALIHLIEQRYNDWEEYRARGRDVSVALLKQFAAECRARDIKFAVAGITRGKDAAQVLAACAAAGIATVDISVNLSEPGARNLPHDDHPSARTQAVYAARLSAFLRAEFFPGPAVQP